VVAAARSKALKLLLSEKFESEQHISETMGELANLKIIIEGQEYPLLDMERLKYKMARILNMYHATGFRNWEGSKLVSTLGYRYLVEQTFLGENEEGVRYFRLKDKYYIDPVGRKKLMLKILSILKAAGINKVSKEKFDKFFEGSDLDFDEICKYLKSRGFLDAALSIDIDFNSLDVDSDLEALFPTYTEEELYALADKITSFLRECNRLAEVSDVLFRSSESWIPLDMLTLHERAIVLNSLNVKDKEENDERWFLLMDEDIRKLIRYKLDYAVIRSDEPLIDPQVGNTDKALEYLSLPENKYAFDRVMTSATLGKPGGQTKYVVEFKVNLRGCIIPMMSRYRGPTSFRIDGISEIRPESAAFVPVAAARLGPNVSTVNFPLYCADKRMGRAPFNEWIAGIGWTWCTQPWAQEMAQLYEYGKLITKEEYEALIISPLEIAAEDAGGGLNKVRNLGQTVYDDNYLGGEGRGLELIGSKGPNEKYAMDYFELVQHFFANVLMEDPLVAPNVKLTHLALTFMFYGVKWLVYINFLFFFLCVVVGGLDLTVAFAFVMFFLGYLCLTSQAINRSMILLYNRLYGLHLGFFIWFHRTFVYPCAMGHFSYYVHRYKIVQKNWTVTGKSDFIPTVRKSADVILNHLELYFAHEDTFMAGAGLWLLYLPIAPFIPQAFFIWEFFWIAIATSLLMYPCLANARMKHITVGTQYIYPLIGGGCIILCGIVSGHKFFYMIAALHFALWLVANMTRDRFQAANRVKTASDYILIILLISALSYQHFALLIPILIWMGIDPNYRGFLIYVVGYSFLIFLKCTKRIFSLHWKEIVPLLVIAYLTWGLNFPAILVVSSYSALGFFAIFMVLREILFISAYNKLEEYYREGNVTAYDTLDQLAGRVGFSGYRFLLGQKMFYKAVKAHQRDNHLIQPLLEGSVVFGDPSNVYVRRYIGESDESLMSYVISHHPKVFKKFISRFGREVGLSRGSVKELMNVEYTGLSTFMRIFSEGFLGDEIERLVFTPGIENRRMKVFNYAPATSVRMIDLMYLHIVAWANQYLVDWIPSQTVPVETIRNNQAGFEAVVDSIAMNLDAVVKDSFDPSRFLEEMDGQIELNRLVQTIVDHPQDTVVEDNLGAKAFLERYGFVARERVENFNAYRSEFNGLVDDVLDDPENSLDRELDVLTLLEKLYPDQVDRIRALAECEDELAELVGSITGNLSQCLLGGETSKKILEEFLSRKEEDRLKNNSSPVLEEGRRVGDILKRWFMAAIESSNPWEYLKNKGIREEIEKWRTAM
ncbi:MAG: hypothetical protein KKF54_03195, partial [Candidatus Omnitrophica bacterium]|nr:hypothetical protein [Candidatus Omnitrophota bacterium]